MLARSDSGQSKPKQPKKLIIIKERRICRISDILESLCNICVTFWGSNYLVQHFTGISNDWLVRLDFDLAAFLAIKKALKNIPNKN